jgi:hypothetical protein
MLGSQYIVYTSNGRVDDVLAAKHPVVTFCQLKNEQ